jgi:tRNA C32,U32 (ribose-2'-O)-methylase TrmJ
MGNAITAQSLNLAHAGTSITYAIAPKQRDAQTQTHRSENREDTDNWQQNNINSFGQRERTPHQEYSPIRSVIARMPGQEPSELNILRTKIKSAGGSGNEIERNEKHNKR